MTRAIFLILVLTIVNGCGFALDEIQTGVHGGVRYAESGGETFSSDPSGHYEKRGDWLVGGDIRFIWRK